MRQRRRPLFALGCFSLARRSPSWSRSLSAPKVLGIYGAPIPGSSGKRHPRWMGRTWQSYKQGLEVNLAESHSRILPSRRRYIPKFDARNARWASPRWKIISMRCGGGVGGNLRRRLPGVLVRVSAWTRSARWPWTLWLSGLPARVFPRSAFGPNRLGTFKIEHATRCAWASSMVRILLWNWWARLLDPSRVRMREGAQIDTPGEIELGRRLLSSEALRAGGMAVLWLSLAVLLAGGRSVRYESLITTTGCLMRSTRFRLCATPCARSVKCSGNA